MASELSAEQIRELMHYDPKTGICLWKIRDSKWFEGKLARWRNGAATHGTSVMPGQK
ncbi:hypothetical protein [Brucella anthropi]|uniref:hypothetical protein n=1 Tax=Brucella anthropi TaxID=529 RepID=UPI000DFCE5CB|nr:hypothetical protein [Brucella anthropi]SUB56209.1 Uncharacterised protein [Brucella anthropi]